jgi:hypothetical protein
VIPAAVADSWFFWLAIIGFIVAVYTLPTVIAIARQVEGIGWVICLNTIPVGWPAALLWACLMPRKVIRLELYWHQPPGQLQTRPRKGPDKRCR